MAKNARYPPEVWEGGGDSAIRCAARLAEARFEASVSSRVDSYDYARAETVIGLFKIEVIRKDGPWRSSRRSSTPL